jgi:hypothetical protein
MLFLAFAMVQPAAKTASGPIAIVAVEQNFTQSTRHVDDFAYWLLPFAARVLVWVTRLNFARNWMLRMTELPYDLRGEAIAATRRGLNSAQLCGNH